MYKDLKEIWSKLKPEEKRYLKLGLKLIALIGVISIFILPFLFTLPAFFNLIDYSTKGPVGDTVNGIAGPFIALLAAILTFLAFYIQYKANIQQRDQFYTTQKEQQEASLEQEKIWRLERFENRFYELLKLHKSNVSEMSFDGTRLVENEDSLFIENKTHEGKAVFNVIFNQFIICRSDLKGFFKRSRIFLPEYEEELLKNPFVVKNNIDIRIMASIDICYCIVFYGVSAEGLLILENLFKRKYKEKFVLEILRFISLKPAFDDSILSKWKVLTNRNTRSKRNELVEKIYEWRKNKTLRQTEYSTTVNNYHNRFIKYYGGHQFRLGHYYRHLFQTVKFVNSQTNIDYDTKYEYLKTLRAQMATYEQAVLFLNSLSKMGQPWEITPEINQKLPEFKPHDFELITKYNLIKNLPGESLYGIRFKDFYPLINYEGEEIHKNRHDYK